jgi:hypothetical protein
VCRRLTRPSFDPRLIGSSLHYLDNGVPSELLVCYLPACGRAADQYRRVLGSVTHRAVAVTPRGFEATAAWRPRLALADHVVLIREFLRVLTARIRPRFTVIAGFSSGADLALRLAAAPDAECRLRLDGCLALGANLSIDTCFLTRTVGRLEGDDDAALLAALREVSDAAPSLDEWVNICEYVVHIVPPFRRDSTPLRVFGAAIAEPFQRDALVPFAGWYRDAAEKGCRLRCVFEDTPMYRGLVRELQVRNLDEGLLGARYEPESIVSEPCTNHFDLLDPVRIDEHVRALVQRMASPAPADRRPATACSD